MSEEPKAKYVATGEYEGHYLNGVPARDLTEEEYYAFPQQVRSDIHQCGLYDVTPPIGGPGPTELPAEPEVVADAG